MWRILHAMNTTFIERSIVTDLLAHLSSKGFKFLELYDGEEYTQPAHPVEYLMNLDEARFYFTGPSGDTHWVVLIRGNGQDIVSDYGYTRTAGDGWNLAMDEFANLCEDKYR